MRLHSLISFSGLALSVTAKRHHGDVVHSAILARQLAAEAQSTPTIPADLSADVEHLAKSLAYLVCEVAEQIRSTAEVLGVVTTRPKIACKDLLPFNGPIVTAIDGSGEQGYPSSAFARSSASITALSVGSASEATTTSSGIISAQTSASFASASETAVEQSATSAPNVETTTSSASSSFVTIVTSVVANAAISETTSPSTPSFVALTLKGSDQETSSTSVALPTPIKAPVNVFHSDMQQAVSGVIQIQIVGDKKVYYYTKDPSTGSATLDKSAAATFSIATKDGTCASLAGAKFDLSTLDFAVGATSKAYLGGTIQAREAFEQGRAAPLSPLYYTSSTPFAISQPNNFYKSRYLETTLWSIKNCSASGPHTLSASWKSESQGAQDVIVCANADSKASVPGSFVLMYNPGGSCGPDWTPGVGAMQVSVTFTFVPDGSDSGAAFYA